MPPTPVTPATSPILPKDITAAIQVAAQATAAAQALTEALLFHNVPDASLEPSPFADVSPETLAFPVAPRLPALVRWGRVHYSCPACRRPTVIQSSFRGKRISCPRCYTAIQVPDPQRRIPGKNLGRTLEPVLHPGRFSQPVDARRMVPWLIGRLPTAGQAIGGTGAALLMSTLLAMAPITLQWAAQDRTRVDFAPVTRPAVTSRTNLKAEAQAAVLAFLTASTPEEKASWVTNRAVTLPLMQEWYARQPAPATLPEIIGSSQGFYASTGSTVPVSEVLVSIPDNPPCTYYVEHLPGGARIAWPESVGYSPLAWKQVLQQPTDSGPIPLRVLACRDDYFNLDFPLEKDFFCLRLHDPLTLEVLGYAYSPRSGSQEACLQRVFASASAGSLQPVQLAVRPLQNSPTTRQVRWEGIVQAGWQSSPPVETARAFAASAPFPAGWFYQDH